MHMAISSPSAVGALDDLIVPQYMPLPSRVSGPPDDSYKSSPLDRSVDSPYPTRIEHAASPAPSTWLAKPVLVALISAILIGCWIGYRQVVSRAPQTIPDAFVGKWQGKIFNRDADPHGNHGNVEATYTIRKDSTMTVYVKEFPPAQNVTASYDGEGLSYAANTGIGARSGYLVFNADRKTLNVRVPRTSGDPPGDTLIQEGTLTRQ
jgi:hypothetical protein